MSKKLRILSALLAMLMLISVLAACGTTTDEPVATGAVDTTPETEGETRYTPDIEKKNYECDFVITGVGEIYGWALVEEAEGEPLSDSIYERSINILDHLGVTMSKVDSGDWITLANEVINTVQAGDDAYQMVCTHPYQGVAALMASGAVYDYADLEAVNLDAPYWAYEFMADLTVDDHFFIGYNDFCLASTKCIAMNKDLMDEYSLTAPYEDVRNHVWTLDKYFNLASTVARDNGDGVWDNQDTYGIAGWGWVELISFVTASDIKIVDKDDTGLYQVAYEWNSEKTLNLVEKIGAMYDAEYSYFWTPSSPNDGKSIDFADGTTLFFMMGTDALPNLRGEDIRFGVLPYPKYDEAQAEYKSLNWNGVMFIPGAIKNPDMVGEVNELLCYYTAPVQTAYYEDLLGSKLAEAPEDAEMLDVIWNSQVSDIGMVCANLAGMDPLLYMVPNLCRDGIDTYASFLKRYSRTANRALESHFSND